MFTYLIDRCKGYFDNLRSDAYFLDLDASSLLNYSASRIQGWTDRHFLLVNTANFSKDHVQDFGERIKLWSDDRIKPHLSNLSKRQISLLKDKPEFVPYFKPSKVYKLVISRKVVNDHFVSFAWNNFKTDTEKRDSLFPLVSPNIISNFSELSTFEYIQLLKRDLTIIKHLKPEMVTPELGDFMADLINLTNISILHTIMDDSARNKLYEAGKMSCQSELCKDFLREDVFSERFDCIHKHRHTTLMNVLVSILEDYLVYYPFKKFNFPLSDIIFAHVWEKGSKKIKHAIKMMIDQRLFDYLSKSYSSSLFEILGDDRFFEFIKGNPGALKSIFESDNFLKKQFLQKYDLKEMLDKIDVPAIEDEDLKILVARDPLLLCKNHLKEVKRIPQAVVQAFIDRNISLEQLPKEVSITKDDLKNKDKIQQLENDLAKLEVYKVSDYKKAKSAFSKELEECPIQGEKMDALKKRWDKLNEADEEFLFSLFVNYIDPKLVSKKTKLENESILKAVEKNNIVTIGDLKDFALYVAKPNGDPDLEAIFTIFKKITQD